MLSRGIVMKFRMKPNLAIEIIMYVVIALQTALIFLLCCKFFEWLGFFVSNLAVEIVELVVCAIVIVLAVLYLTCHYIIKDGKIMVMYGPFDLNFGQLKIADIMSVHNYASTGKLSVILKNSENDETTEIAISINKNQVDAFFKALVEVNPDIVMVTC